VSTLRPFCDTAGDQVAVNVLEWVFLQTIQIQVAVVLVPLRDALSLLEAGDSLAALLQRVVELLVKRQCTQ